MFYLVLKKQLFQWFEINSLEVLFYTIVATVLLRNDYLIKHIHYCLHLLRTCITVRILNFCGKEHRRNRSNDTYVIKHLCSKITFRTTCSQRCGIFQKGKYVAYAFRKINSASLQSNVRLPEKNKDNFKVIFPFIHVINVQFCWNL